MLLPGTLKREFDLLEANANTVLTASLREVIDDQNHVIKKSWGLLGLKRPMRGAAVIRHVVGLGINAIGEPGGVLMRRDAFEQAGGWDFTHPYVVDLSTYLHVLTLGDFVRCDSGRKIPCQFRTMDGRVTGCSESTCHRYE